ncbi:MAG: hypothetical protein WCH42_00900 [Actinomycetes bacterium]
MVRFLLAIAAGVVLGFSTLVIHNAWPPVGLIFALLETAVGIYLVGSISGSRWLKLPAALGWLAIVLRAGTHGVSFEILVMGNTTGNIFLLAGISLLVIVGLKRV